MDVHVRVLLLDGLQQVNVEVAVHVRRQSCLDAYLCRTKACRFPGPPHNLLGGKEVAFLLPKVPAESAKSALLYADVGEIDVPVHHVCNDIANRPAPQLVSHQHKEVHLKAVAVKQLDGFLHRYVLAVQCPVKGRRYYRVCLLENRIKSHGHSPPSPSRIGL